MHPPTIGHSRALVRFVPLVTPQLLDDEELCVEMDDKAKTKDAAMFELWGMEFC
jgi:hypothetical protein